MSRIRVLHVVQNLNYGGMERLIWGIARSLDGSRFESHILALQYLGRFARGLESVAELHEGHGGGSFSLIFPRELSAHVGRIAPHVVHTHSGVWYKASLAARLARIRAIIHTEHGLHIPDSMLGRFQDRLAARWTPVMVAVSTALAEAASRRVLRSLDRIHVVPNGVDTDAFRPRPDQGRLHTELALEAGRPVLGSVGRLEAVKGYDVMIEAFGLLRSGWRDGPAPALVLVGDGSEKERLLSSAAERNLDGDVHFLGWRDDLETLLPGFSLFTISSHSEGTSVSLLEAMASGLCPVVTAVGGNADVLGEELAHRLVPAANPAALAEGWRSALTHPDRRARDGERARRRVEESFSLHEMVRRYETLYIGLGSPAEDRE